MNFHLTEPLLLVFDLLLEMTIQSLRIVDVVSISILMDRHPHHQSRELRATLGRVGSSKAMYSQWSVERIRGRQLGLVIRGFFEGVSLEVVVWLVGLVESR